VSRLSRYLPIIAVVSAVLTTVVFAAAFSARLDALSKDLSRNLAEFGSFAGTTVATKEEVESAHRSARILRSAWRVLAAVFVASTATVLWQKRDHDWRWLSALAFLIGLAVLAFGIGLSEAHRGPPMVLGVAATALSGIELVHDRRGGRPTSTVTWAALVVSIAGLLANLVRLRGF
jgi:hypothetical protein